MRGFIIVWGGPLDEVQQCEIDSHGNVCGGPELDCQSEIEDQIQDGETDGTTSDGYSWEYR